MVIENLRCPSAEGYDPELRIYGGEEPVQGF